MKISFTAFFLEILNGGAVTPETLWLLLIGIYLVREAKRRDLHAFDWFNLPSSMNLILAVFICDVGVQVRSIVIWWWRFNGAGEFNEFELTLLMIGGGLIFIGYLCKIRALTRPEYGNGVWYASAAVSALAVAALLLLH